MDEQPAAKLSKRPSRRMTPARVLKRLGFSLALLVVILVALNLIFSTRTFLKPITRSDPDLLYALKENSELTMSLRAESPFQWKDDELKFHVSVNAAGFRGPLVTRDPAGGEFRILCLGDSITMGLGIDDDQTWTVQLERLLAQARPDLHATVINGGVYGYSSRQGIYLLQQKFLAFRPRLVIWGYGWNDSVDDFFIKQRDLRMVPMAPGAPTAGVWQDRLKYRLGSLPVVLAAVKYTFLLKTFIDIGRLMEAANTAQQASVKLNSPRITALNFQNARVPPAAFEQHLELLYHLSRQQGFDLVLLAFYPTPRPYRDILNDFARSHGIRFVNFFDRFEKLRNQRWAETDPTYHQVFEEYRAHLNDGALEGDRMLGITVNGMHPNRIGAAVIAADLCQSLLARKPAEPEGGGDSGSGPGNQDR